MPTTEGLPLPGERVESRDNNTTKEINTLVAAGRPDIVIASAWSDRDGEDGVAYVILLRPEPPYYSVLLLQRAREANAWRVTDERRVHNIQEAAQDFEDYGGPARSDFLG